MKRGVFVLAVSALLALFPATARAGVTGLDGASLGEHWYGPERTLEGLKGHIVLWENWGYN